MNTNCNDIQLLMLDVLAGSAAQGGQSRLDEHLASCDACRREWALLESITEAPEHRPDPGQEFWDGYLGRLEERMERADSADVLPRASFSLVPRRVLQVAAAIAILAIGVLLGRASLSEDGPFPVPGEMRTELAALDAEAWSVLDRSRTLLLDVANFDASQDLPADLNLDRRQTAASQLVREAADVRSRMSEADRQRMMDLLSDLEVILLQLAHLDAEVDLPQIEMMQNGMDRKALFFKIDIESMNRPDESTSTEVTADRPQPRRSAI